MFDADKWQEIFTTIQQNKLRTFLTGFSVGWGIFMLIILLGAGQGIFNGVESMFNDDAINSIWIKPGQTTMEYKGFKSGRRVKIHNEDYDYLLSTYEGIDEATARDWVWGVNVNYRNEYGSYGVRGCHPGHKYLEKTEMISGRYLNEKDIQEARKVAVIGKLVEQDLFKRESAIGAYINISGIPFKVTTVVLQLLLARLAVRGPRVDPALDGRPVCHHEDVALGRDHRRAEHALQRTADVIKRIASDNGSSRFFRSLGALAR